MGQAQTGQGVGALSKGDVLRKNLNHIGATLAVQNVAWVPQKMSEGLTAAAIAHRPIRKFWTVDVAPDRSASTLQRVLHLQSRYPCAHQRGIGEKAVLLV